MPARTASVRKGRANFYQHGTNNAICDRSGFKIKATQGRFEWNGFFVLAKFWEERQPQDFLRGFPDPQQPEVTRPGTGDDFLVETEPHSQPETASDDPVQVTSRNTVTADDL